MNQDQLTGVVRKSINVLFVSNPRGTSIGVFLGVILDGVLGLFSPFLKTIEVINISAIKMWHLVGLGVIVLNLPSYLRRNEIDPSIIKGIDYIRKQKENGTISDWQARKMYENLHQKVLENIILDTERSETAKKVNEFVVQSQLDKEKPDGDN